MGYKIRDDAPRALSLPVPVGGGDFSPTTNERIYEIGQPIEVITTDIVERFENGDEHLVRFIEEVVEIETEEVEPAPAPGDVNAPVSAEPPAQPAAEEQQQETPPEPEPAPAPIEPEQLTEESVAAEEQPSASEGNPFAS